MEGGGGGGKAMAVSITWSQVIMAFFFLPADVTKRYKTSKKRNV